VVLRSFVVGAAALAACSSAPEHAVDAPTSAWRLGPVMPRAARDPGVALLGQQIVVAGGFDASGQLTTRVDAFDIADAAWRSLPDAPVAWASSNLAVIGATLYLAGGLDGTGAHGETFLLDPIDQGWQSVQAIDPAAARGAAGVVSVPGRIFLLGGASSTGVVDTCLQYDIIADCWTPLPPLPVARAHPAAMRTVDGTLIVAGGFASLDSSAPLGDVWALPPLATAWQPRTPMHLAGDGDLRGGCAYGVVLGELVCAGGAAGPDGRTAVDGYDPYTDVWTAHEPMPIEHTGTPGVAAGARLFVPGGSATLGGAATDTLYIYSPLDTAPR
jgi:hypothetical protein